MYGSCVMDLCDVMDLESINAWTLQFTCYLSQFLRCLSINVKVR